MVLATILESADGANGEPNGVRNQQLARTSEIGQATPNIGWHDSQIEILSTGEVKVRTWNLTSISLGTVAFNQWHHVALVYDSAAQRVRGYLDGVKATTEPSGNRQAPFESGNEQRWAFGAADSTHQGSGAYFRGQIDDVRVWRTARTTVATSSWATRCRTATTVHATRTTDIIRSPST